MSYKATDVARQIISAAHTCGDEITPLKLQKILYYTQGAYLALKGRPAFDEEILAWRLGPVVYSVYSEFKECKDKPIPPQSKVALDDGDDIFISEVYKKYRGFTAGQLVDKTHEESPWKDAESDLIDIRSMKDYFSNVVYNEYELFSGSPIVSRLPKDMYDSSEDDIEKSEHHRIPCHMGKIIQSEF
jgi:uncharacterized phage-associated protein